MLGEWTLEKLSELCDELREISQEPSAPSRSLIALNRLFVGVETYLSERGLRCDSRGFWFRRHWSYRLLEQLSASIESCKEPSAHVSPALIRFVEESLLPQLHREAERLN